MKDPFFYILVPVLVLLDAWLLAHPNLIGRAGIFFYDYNYLKTFPRALGTVAAVVGVAFLLISLFSRASKNIALLLLLVFGMANGYLLANIILQFDSGVYKLTGAGFRAGVVLLPSIVIMMVYRAMALVVIVSQRS